MIVPIAVLFLLLSAIFLVVGLVNRNGIILLSLHAAWWLLSLVSAFFTGWAWLERGYSENWAMYGIFFISLPVIATISVSVIPAMIFGRIRKIEPMRRLELSGCLLLLFLAAQVVVGFLAG